MSERQTQQGKSAGISVPHRDSSGLLQRKCNSCGQHTIAGGTCGSCEKRKGVLQRKLMIGASNDPLEVEADRVADQVMAAPAQSPVNGAPLRIQRYAVQPGAPAAPPSVDHVLASPGRPLEPALRQDMEQRFGHDFSRVRVHSGAAAEQSTCDVNAYAYTVGQDIVFGGGQYTPGTHQGRRLIAHELTHVVQQSGSKASSPDQNGNRRHRFPGNAEHAQIHSGYGTKGLQRLGCETLLNAKEGERVEGIAAERQIRTDFILQAGFQTTLFNIPGASAQAKRDENCGGKPKEPRGQGIPDLLFIDGKNVEIAEIKIGTWPCRWLAEEQVNTYVEKGNSPENAKWRQSLGVDRFLRMPPSRFSLAPISIDQKLVQVTWCGPGVILYKPISRQDQDTFICSNLSDKGTVDRFLNRAFDQGQVIMQRYLAQVITTLSGAINKEVSKVAGPGMEALWRPILDSLVTRIATMLREQMQSALRQYLQQTLNALCATALSQGLVSLNDMLDTLDKQKELVLVPVLIAIAAQLAKEAAEAAFEAVKGYLVAIVITAAVVALYWIIKGMQFRLPGLAPSPKFATGSDVGDQGSDLDQQTLGQENGVVASIETSPTPVA